VVRARTATPLAIIRQPLHTLVRFFMWRRRRSKKA
jgi:hypothetical protein